MQQNLPVPPALVRMSQKFYTSRIRDRWRSSHVPGPPSICETSFKLVNLWSIFKNEKSTACPQSVHAKALAIVADLKAWRSSVTSDWLYIVEDVPGNEFSEIVHFQGKRHLYQNAWAAEIWSNWRIMTILVGHIIFENSQRSTAPTLDETDKASFISAIRECAVDTCISSSSFMGTACESLYSV